MKQVFTIKSGGVKEMMTLEEVWENLRQDPETKATMEEAEKSYKLFKKIENLIVADLESKLNEKTKLAEGKKRCQECKHINKKIELNIKNKLMVEIQQLKQQLAECEQEKLLNSYGMDKNADIAEDYKRKLAESKEQLIDMNEKSNKIKKESYYLKKQLAETDKLMQEYLSKCLSLEQQLTEKEKEIEELKKGVYKVTLGTTPSNQIDFTENFYVIQNQTTIEELEKVKEYISKGLAFDVDVQIWFEDYIDQQITELKGEE
jgi:chromosome segregation ATPase